MNKYTLILIGLAIFFSIIIGIWSCLGERFFFKEFDFTRAKSDELRSRGPLS
jgi:hypothetical protein